jgi:hypothetical protein
MNNTKWREVFTVILRYNLHFSIKFKNDNKNFNSRGNQIKNLINLTGIDDPGIGGPFKYVAIDELFIPYKFQVIDMNREFNQRSQLIDNLSIKSLAEITSLGKLPILQTETGIAIKAIK